MNSVSTLFIIYPTRGIMNLFGVKCSQGQLLCCVLCFLVGYFFRSFFHREGFKLNAEALNSYGEMKRKQEERENSKCGERGTCYNLFEDEEVRQGFDDDWRGMEKCIDFLGDEAMCIASAKDSYPNAPSWHYDKDDEEEHLRLGREGRDPGASEQNYSEICTFGEGLPKGDPNKCSIIFKTCKPWYDDSCG